ncbi:MAG: ion transporter [Phyllobacteriaceae bacterium]|nr:ion transporter [Phyllobacteriaceae bacterium]
MKDRAPGLRDRLAAIVAGDDPRFGNRFDEAMLIVILVSLAALGLETVPAIPGWLHTLCIWIERASILLFTAEYAARLGTAKKAWKYATSFWGVIDFLAVAPWWLTMGGAGFQAIRSLRLLRILRALKLVRHLAAIDRVRRAFELVREEMAVFGLLALILLFIAGVGIYEFEHEAQPVAFSSIPQSLWFVVVTLTTVGYGDVYPVTTGGKLFTVLILVTGIGIVALPTSLITTGLTRAREEEKARKQKPAAEQT